MLRAFEKYPYKKIQKETVDGDRKYDTPSGKLPSVTTILSATKSKESLAALKEWRARVGNSEATRITTEAANVGTIMHNILENWILEKEYNPGNNVIHRQAKSMAEEIKSNIEKDIQEIWGTEINLYYPDLYAGTTDLVGVYKNKPAIMDFKQTNKPKKREWIDDYFLQAAAYGMAHNILYDTDIKTAAIFMCARDGTFQCFELGQEEFEKWSIEWANRLDRFYNG
jgi:genome maintenance exonuclease 1